MNLNECHTIQNQLYCILLLNLLVFERQESGKMLPFVYFVFCNLSKPLVYAVSSSELSNL